MSDHATSQRPRFVSVLLLLGFILMLLPASAWAKVDVCNIGDTDLYVAKVAPEEGGRWVAEGWYLIHPQACERLVEGFEGNAYFGFAVQNRGGRFGMVNFSSDGPQPRPNEFCVHPAGRFRRVVEGPGPSALRRLQQCPSGYVRVPFTGFAYSGVKTTYDEDLERTRRWRSTTLRVDARSTNHVIPFDWNAVPR